MTPWVLAAIFVVVISLTAWCAVDEGRSQREFNQRWNAHDIHWDSDRYQWRHDGTCPCNKGPYPIRWETQP